MTNDANIKDQVTDLASLNTYTKKEYARIHKLPDSKLKINDYEELIDYVSKTQIELGKKKYNHKEFILSMNLLQKIKISLPQKNHTAHKSIQNELDTLNNQIQLCAKNADDNVKQVISDSLLTKEQLQDTLNRMRSKDVNIKKIVTQINLIWNKFKETKPVEQIASFASKLWKVIAKGFEQVKIQMMQLSQAYSVSVKHKIKTERNTADDYTTLDEGDSLTFEQIKPDRKREKLQPKFKDARDQVIKSTQKNMKTQVAARTDNPKIGDDDLTPRR